MTIQFTPPIVQAIHPDFLRPPKHSLRLGFLTSHNPYDRRPFSGTAFFAARALLAQPDIDLRILGPHREPGKFDRLKKRFLRRPDPVPDPDQIDVSGLDAVVGLVATDLIYGLQRRCDIPVLHVTDATPGFLREAYGWDVPMEADITEAQIAKQAAATVYSSDYMAARARQELGTDIAAHVVPFGINFENLPEIYPAKSWCGPLELLFVCSDWDRKGGPHVLATLDALRALGIDARLTVAGRVPDHLHNHPAMTFAGFLNKNCPDQAARLKALYRNAHLMLLPSRGDCTPMVVAEAMAHGTPVIARDTGGMATLIAPGTGTIMGASEGTNGWVRAVQRLTEDPVAYAQVSQQAFAHAKSTLTWNSWASGIKEICRQASVQQKPAA